MTVRSPTATGPMFERPKPDQLDSHPIVTHCTLRYNPPHGRYCPSSSAPVIVLQQCNNIPHRYGMVGAIPNIVALLKDLHWRVLSRALSVPGEGFKGRFQAAIAIVIPRILTLLTDSDSDVLSSAVPGENSRARCNEFRAAIAVVIPDVVILLKDSDSDIRSSVRYFSQHCKHPVAYSAVGVGKSP
ncbi:hypothetical protein BU17DRAFT_92161 [Hysterangium stoloniferum]|nr:hypothetical protein BU17DRAFT_92161 [Hysterangium stoloniferum]